MEFVHNRHFVSVHVEYIYMRIVVPPINCVERIGNSQQVKSASSIESHGGSIVLDDMKIYLEEEMK